MWGEGKQSRFLCLSSSLLVSLCPWPVLFTSASELLSPTSHLSLRTGRLEGAEVGISPSACHLDFGKTKGSGKRVSLEGRLCYGEQAGLGTFKNGPFSCPSAESMRTFSWCEVEAEGNQAKKP